MTPLAKLIFDAITFAVNQEDGIPDFLYDWSNEPGNSSEHYDQWDYETLAQRVVDRVGELEHLEQENYERAFLD